MEEKDKKNPIQIGYDALVCANRDLYKLSNDDIIKWFCKNYKYIYEFVYAICNEGGVNSYTYLTSIFPRDVIPDIKNSQNETQRLAIFTEVFNSLRHALVEAGKTFNSYGMRNKSCETYEAQKLCSGLKFLGIKKLEQYCYDKKYRYYGNYMDGDRPAFIIDIPGCGQVKWHLKNNQKIGRYMYTHEVQSKDGAVTNMHKLYRDFPRTEIPSTREKIVRNSKTEDEMLERLKCYDFGGKDDVAERMGEFLGASKYGLEITGADGENVTNLIVYIRKKEPPIKKEGRFEI